MTFAVPAVEQPKEIAAAVAAVGEAEQHVAAAQQRQREAAIALDRAREADRADLAARIAAGDENPAPSREHRDLAEEQAEAAHEVYEAAATNVADSYERLERLTAEYAGAWAERIIKARQKADEAYLRALDKLAELEQRRADLRGAGAWLERRVTGGTQKLVPVPGRLPMKHPQHADAQLPAALAIDLLRAYVEGSTVEAEAAAEQQRREAEAAAEERQRAMTQARAGIPGA
jgi:hypothetical protein